MSRFSTLSLAALLLVVAAPAQAASLTPQQSRLAAVPPAPPASGAVVTGSGPSFDPVAYAPDPGNPTVVVPATGATYSYDRSYGPLAVIPGSTLLPGQPDGFTFFDNYVFSISDSLANSSTTSIRLGNFGIESLQARLYALDAAAPNLYYGAVPTGAVYLAWATVAGPLQVVVLDEISLPAGLYTLEIRGRTLSAGGSYGGVINFAPIPLPAAGWLLLSGVGLLLLRGTRRVAPAAA